MTTYAMISDKALQRFRAQRAAGQMPTRLPPGSFEPAGAFDALPRGLKAKDNNMLSPSIRKGLDALSKTARDQLRDYLSRDVANLEDE
jgi:hypothetical protein